MGGGPGGLFFATLIKQADPSAEVTLFERNRPDDVFGFGVVFSDATLAGIHRADPVLREALATRGRHWDAIEVRLKGERIRCGGNGMAAIHRRTLLAVMRARATEVGVDMRFGAEVSGPEELADYDLIVAADGANSRFRERLAAELRPRVDNATAKFIWFGTDYMFDGLTFVHQRGPHGVFAVHGYPISEDISTFIVETDEETWRAAELDEFDVASPPGPSDEKTARYLEELFAEQIGGHRLLVNNSRWANFHTRRARRWHAGNVVLLGDAMHTAHFSVGSGTKMAMEDAVALAAALETRCGDLESALAAYEAERRPPVEKIQNSARPSLAWWEHFGRYHDAFDPLQFTFHFLSRSIGKSKLARRDWGLVADVEADWRKRHGAAPLDSPLRVGPHTSTGRRATVEVARDGAVAVLPGGARVPLRDGAATEAGQGLWLAAPEDESDLPHAFARLAAAVRTGPPPLAAVHGGTPLTRVLLAEQARLGHHVPAMIVEDPLDDDRAETLLLSGRADLVGSQTGGRPA
ncbi:FAD-dependent monooxygenase [Actinomadura mexicana]|uniref:FAD-dependent monooxygenase n=1 Tax=Actinomadura mexicana TaxID=134959 RepID=UPI001FE51C85|nr:FAD-dependent monooxygenase [Actinomadura mexicana]